METLRHKLFGALVIASGFLIGLNNPVLAEEQDFEDTIIYTDTVATNTNTSASETIKVEEKQEAQVPVVEAPASQSSTEVTKAQDEVTSQKTEEKETSAPTRAPSDTLAATDEATRDGETEEYTITINFWDTSKETPEIVKTYTIGKSENLTARLTDMVTGLNTTNYSFTVGLKTYTFKGWSASASESDILTSTSFKNYPNLAKAFYAFNINDKYKRINIAGASELNENVIANIYIIWDVEDLTPPEPPHVVNYHIKEDTRRGFVGKVSYTKTDNDFPNHSVITIHTQDAFIGETTDDGIYYTHISQQSNIHIDHEEGQLYPQVTVSSSPVIYYLKGWKDSAGNIIGSEGYQLPEYESRIISSVEVIKDNTPSDSTNSYSLRITYRPTSQIIADGYNKEDYDIYFTPIFEGFTTAILDANYIDNVDTGSGSWSNPSGGVVEYSHTFKNPEDGTPKYDYEFLYWQFEEIDDNQIDSEREYKAGDVFEYDLFWKPDKWTETVNAYAWWQPAITLNLYNDSESMSTNHDHLLYTSGYKFDKAEITINPTRQGYDFVGWVDENGNIVTDTIFNAPAPSKEVPNAEEGVNVPVVVNLFAKWKRTEETITVSKVWADESNDAKHRPVGEEEPIVLELYATREGETLAEDAEPAYTVTLTGTKEENTWSQDLTIFPYDEEGNLLVYSIKEKDSILSYVSTYSITTAENGKKTYTVTNTVKEDGTVIVKHLDIDTGEPIAPEETITDSIDQPYETAAITTNPLYAFVEMAEGSAPATGAIVAGTQTVTYLYERQIGYITVHIVNPEGKYITKDKKGNAIEYRKVVSGTIGDNYSEEPYNIQPITIYGYKNIASDGTDFDGGDNQEIGIYSKQGVFTKEGFHIFFVYEEAEGKVTVHYVDTEENVIAEPEVLTGKVGERYNTANQVKNIDGYIYLFNKKGNQISGTFTEEDIDVYYVYLNGNHTNDDGLKGDIFIRKEEGEWDTESTAVFTGLFENDKIDIGTSLEIAPIKQQLIDTVNAMYELLPYPLTQQQFINMIRLQNVNSGFTTTLTIPNGINVENAEYKLMKLDGANYEANYNGMFELIPVNTTQNEDGSTTVTIQMVLKDQTSMDDNSTLYSQFSTMATRLAEEPDYLTFIIYGAAIESGVKNETLTISGNVNGSLDADATVAFERRHFGYDWASTQNNEEPNWGVAKDYTITDETNHVIQLTLEVLAKSEVIVHYVDRATGESIPNLEDEELDTYDETTTYVVGEHYETEQKVIPNYTFDHHTYNTNGTVTIDPIEVTYFYVKNTSQVIIQHIGVKDNEETLLDEDTITGNVGDPYTTSPESFTHYTLDETKTENAEGNYAANEITAKYYYNWNQGTVTVKHVDADTNEEIALQDTLTGNVDDAYEATAKPITHYTNTGDSGNRIGEFAETAKEVIFYYTRNIGKVIVNYVDEEGNLLDSVESTGKVALEDEEDPETFTTELKKFENYTLDDNQEIQTVTYTEDDQTITYTYTKNNGVVNVHYMDVTDPDNTVEFTEAQETIDNQKIGSTYETVEKSFEHYTLVETPANATGTVEATPIEVVYNYVRNIGKVIVHHIDVTDPENPVEMATDEYTGKVSLDGEEDPDTYTTSGRTFTHLEQISPEEDYEGTFQEEPLDLTYEYVWKQGKVTVHYREEGADIDLATDEPIYGDVDESYNVTPQTHDELANYTLVGNSGNINATFTEEDIDVYFYYVINSGTVIVHHIDADTNEDIDTVTLSGNIGEGYTTSVLEDIEPYELVEPLPTNATGEYQDELQEVNYYYRKPRGVVEVYYRNLLTGNLIEGQEVEEHPGYVDESYKIEPANIEGYEFVRAEPEEDLEGYYPYKETKRITLYYMQIGKVITHYYELDTTDQVADDVESTGWINTNYLTNPAENVEGYSLVATPTNATGQYSVDLTEVIYYYQKLGNVITHFLDNNGNVLAEPTSQSGVVGEPYTTEAIDVEGYELTGTPDNAEGEFATEDIDVNYIYTEITEPETVYGYVHVKHVTIDGEVLEETTTQYEVGEGYTTTALENENYELIFTSGDETGIVEVGTKEIVYVYKEKTTPTPEPVITEGTVIAYYVDENGNAIETPMIITNTIGSTYITYQKVIKGYTGTSVPENAVGKIEQELLELTYTYAKDETSEDPEQGEGNCNNCGCCSCNTCNCEQQQPQIVINITNENNNDNSSDNSSTNTNENNTDVTNENNNQDENNVNNENNPTNNNEVTTGDTNVENNTTTGDTNVTTGDTTTTVETGDTNITTGDTNVTTGDTTIENNPTVENNTNVETGDTTIENNPTNTVETGDTNVTTGDTNVENNTTVENNPTNNVENNTEVDASSTNENNNSSESNPTTENNTSIENNPTNTNEANPVNNVDVVVEPTITNESNPTNTNETNPTNTNENNPTNNNDGSNTNINENNNNPSSCEDESCQENEDPSVDPVVEPKVGRVIVRYLDEEGYAIAPTVTIDGNVNDDYVTDQLRINGYEMDRVEGETEDSIKEEPTYVTYYYRAAQEEAPKNGLVLVHYVDTEGKAIASDEVINGTVGDQYVAIEKVIKGYELLDVVKVNRAPVRLMLRALPAGKPNIGTITEEIIELNFIYEAVEAEEEPCENNCGTTNVIVNCNSCDKEDEENPEPKKGTLIVYYFDSEGNALEAEETTTEEVGAEYQTSPKEIEGYELLNVVGQTEGNYIEGQQIVIYIYQVKNTIVEEFGELEVHYVDTEGNVIAETETSTSLVGNPYHTEPKEIPEYKYLRVDGDADGTYVAGTTIVTYVYEKVTDEEPETLKSKVIVNYVDINGKKISGRVIFIGTVGTEYETYEKTIDGYYLVRVEGNTKGTYTTEEQEVTYVYESLEGEGNTDVEPEPEKEPEAKTGKVDGVSSEIKPPHTIVDKNYESVYFLLASLVYALITYTKKRTN